MNVSTEERDGILIAHIRGDVDSRTSSALREQLMPLVRPDARIVLDMSEVTFLSSAGLRTLLLLYRQITQTHGQVVLAGLSPVIRDTMAVTGFLDFFADYPVLEEGLEALRR